MDILYLHNSMLAFFVEFDFQESSRDVIDFLNLTWHCCTNSKHLLYTPFRTLYSGSKVSKSEA